MPPQKRQRARTSGKGAAKKVRSHAAAPRRAKAKEPAARQTAKKPRPARRRQANEPVAGQAKEQVLRAILPGDLYEQAGQWWWRTRLPGEEEDRPRPLKSPETGQAVTDRDAAEKAAVELWGQAAARHGARQITMDCTQKVERLKAQFLDKVRQLTEIVEAAKAKAQAEAKAREEIEARLNAMIQAAQQEAAAPAPAEPPLPAQVPEPAATVAVPPSPVERVEPIEPPADPKAVAVARPLPNEVEAPRPTWSEAAEILCTPEPEPLPLAVPSHDVVPQTGICECCGAVEVPVSDLEAIDSGQLLCPDCIAALHIDIARIEANAFSDSRA